VLRRGNRAVRRRHWLKTAAHNLYDFAGDKRTKNCALLVLAVLTAFGMVAPEQATSIRDSLLSLAL
jgi:hypothetical protein